MDSDSNELMSEQQSYVTIDILGPLVKGKYLILGFALLAVGGGMVREYLAPMRYESNASILVVANDAQSSTLQSLLGAKGPSMLGLISGIIGSRNVREKISSENKIALEDLDAKFKIETSPEANKIEFIAYGDQREKADSINRTAINALNDLNSTLGISVSKKRSDSVKSALDARQTELDKAQQDLADFQRKMKTPVDPDTPSSVGTYVKQLRDIELEEVSVNEKIAAARSRAASLGENDLKLPTDDVVITGWRQKVVDMQYQLKLAQQEYGPQAPKVVLLQRQLAVTLKQAQDEISKYVSGLKGGLNSELASLEAQRTVITWSKAFVKELVDAAPQEAVEFFKRYRNVQTLATVVTTLRGKYEEVKIDSEVDKVLWTVLDSPKTQKEPINKKYPKMAAIWFVLGLFGGSILTLLIKRKQVFVVTHSE